ncbi:hypothetical protein [Paraliobacillus ryukyuensis]|uniref:hypothetical protein n=1 Tax=Paraliobacillus ryukyuensis TaxID=200904 RepID=UPI0009A6049E|nr:hypothetical protein [Paraliobacillus ryukyuensis]
MIYYAFLNTTTQKFSFFNQLHDLVDMLVQVKAMQQQHVPAKEDMTEEFQQAFVESNGYKLYEPNLDIIEKWEREQRFAWRWETSYATIEKNNHEYEVYEKDADGLLWIGSIKPPTKELEEICVHLLSEGKCPLSEGWDIE